MYPKLTAHAGRLVNKFVMINDLSGAVSAQNTLRVEVFGRNIFPIRGHVDP